MHSDHFLALCEETKKEWSFVNFCSRGEKKRQMIGFIGVIAAITVLALSLIITRLATSALALTGLSHEAARFQARSAFTGTGFTTSEAEKVVDHPVRRRIILLLMTARSAGLVTIIITLILSFGTGAGRSQLLRLLGLAGGVAVLWLISGSKQVDRYLERIIERALARRRKKGR